MTKRNYVEEQMERSRVAYQAHEAKCLHTGPDLKLYSWKAPHTWVYGMRFIIHRRWLAILGDVGESTYEWSEDITPEFLLNIDFGYFRSKCRASEDGDKFEIFAADEGREALKEEARQSAESDPRWSAQLHSLADGIDKCSNLDEWTRAVWELYEGTYMDAEAAGFAHRLAVFPHPRQIAQFVGVQMALRALASENP